MVELLVTVREHVNDIIHHTLGLVYFVDSVDNQSPALPFESPVGKIASNTVTYAVGEGGVNNVGIVYSTITL